jgi:hypothetical protein
MKSYIPFRTYPIIKRERENSHLESLLPLSEKSKLYSLSPNEGEKSDIKDIMAGYFPYLLSLLFFLVFTNFLSVYSQGTEQCLRSCCEDESRVYSYVCKMILEEYGRNW